MTLYETIFDAVINIIMAKESMTPKEVENILDSHMAIYSNIFPGESVNKEELLKDILQQLDVVGGGNTALVNNKDHHEWLSNEKADIEWNYWKRYEKYLRKYEKYAPSVIQSLDKSTDNVLKLLESPRRSGKWDRRGMVVGNIQSGKTSNYTGVICKAVDAGYKVIIVLAGLNNDLRSQTQKRIDKGFLGRDTSKKTLVDQSSSVIGAGKIPSTINFNVNALTSSDTKGDYKSSVHNAISILPGGDPVIAVVKKNVTPLKNLLEWLQNINESGRISDIPLLLIDDEADNASIDTNAEKKIGSNSKGNEKDPTKINGLIRKILNCFDQSAYVGYTATPFANVFIHSEDNVLDENEFGEDLFPRSFIVNLQAPSNYMGPDKVFGLFADKTAGIKSVDPLPLTRKIDDYEEFFPEKHKKTLIVDALPNSLYKAIYSFIISNAIRDFRGQANKHHSMLVHVTRFVDVQTDIVELVSSAMERITNQLEYKTGPQYNTLIKNLELLFEQDFAPTTKVVISRLDDPGITSVTWEDIKPLLYKVVSKIEVKAINGKAADGGLNYELYPNGCSVIAIGGDKLSRGLTLEGLSVSYYTRISKMYDTLLQMGRWFGYRPGYADVCRLFTSETLVQWYKHLAVVNEEFRSELDAMTEIPDATPATYGLKVRTHPDGMIVTALNKMRNSEKAKVTYSGRLAQTSRFYIDNPINKQNVAFIDRWAAELEVSNAAQKIKGNYVWRDVSPQKIFEFINNVTIHKSCFDISPSIVRRYIEAQNEEGELIKWTVCIVSVNNPGQVGNSDFRHKIEGVGEIGLSWRTDGLNKESIEKSNYLEVVRRQLITENDEFIDLDEGEYADALEKTSEDSKKSIVKKPSPKAVRACRSPEKGLLLIYYFKSGETEEKYYENIYTGYALSFPESPTAKEVEYKIDEVFFDNNLLDEGYEEDED